MTKPKTEAQRRKDKMARFHNKMVVLVSKSDLDVPELYMVLDNIKLSLLTGFRKATKQE